jgi:sensor histidine kinase YesM
MKKNTLYILLQIGGWLSYISIAFIFEILRGKPITFRLVITLLSVFLIGMGISHVYRYFIHRFHWNKLSVLQLLPRILSAVVACSIVFQFVFVLSSYILFRDYTKTDFSEHYPDIISWSILMLMWSVIYFAFQFFERYRQEEIKNLKWEATKNEIELNKLKSQLNPHFIFNSMNSIRALVDEDPVKAKKSVTQLANILRNTLMMGRKKTVSFEEEFAIVQDYVELEKTRYEERLRFSSDIHPQSYQFQVPSLMIQSLIENGIKHGISKIASGGEIKLTTDVKNNALIVNVENAGHLDVNSTPETGFGIINTTQRLNLLYGKNATFDMHNSTANTVITQIVLPKTAL